MPTPSEQMREQIRTLTDANAGLAATVRHQEQKIRLLQVVASILLAIIASLSAELATSLLGATAQTAFVAVTGVFFGVVAASIGILGYMHRA